MTRQRNNEDNAIEELEQEIKRLKSIIRHLEKEIKKSNKKYRAPKIVEEEEQPYDEVKSCPLCIRGQLRQVVLGELRTFMTCSDCNYRSKTMKIK